MTESPCSRAGWGHPTSAGIFSFVSGPLLLLTNHILIKHYLGRLWGHSGNHGDTTLKTHGLCGPAGDTQVQSDNDRRVSSAAGGLL